ncbi:MAG: Fic family protein [Sphaerochaeta sp.]|nr:Fic family protein [Sphaerochaeta sp.]
MATTFSTETEYIQIPNHDQILLSCEKNIFIRLTTQTDVDVPSICDTRSIHYEMFNQLIPSFAGKYRGEPGVNYAISFAGRCGCPYPIVLQYMDSMVPIIRTKIEEFEQNAACYDKYAKFYNLAVLASWIVSNFISIHAYVNGNGHISRYIIAALFIPNQYCSKHWTIHHHPISDQDYIDSMSAALKNDYSVLINLLERCF